MAKRPAYRPTGRSEIKRLKDDLEDLFLRCEELDEALEVVGDLNRYLCVRVSGFFEQAIMSCGRAVCEKMSGGPAKAFALSWLDRSSNPRAEELIRMIARFSPAWAEELRIFLSSDERAARINTLLGIRNDIAHGKNQGVSRSQAWDYYELTSEIVDWLLDKCDPLPKPVQASAESVPASSTLPS
jgi:hypothetical protein